MSKIKVGIIGGAGYTSGELLRLLIRHPKIDIDFIYSTSQGEKPVYSVHEDLIGETSLKFTQKVNEKIDLVFLCLGHGNSKKFLEKNQFSPATKIIDLSNDFRLKENAKFLQKKFIYGLPELQKEKIKNASYIANPGCFATAIQLALLPLAKNKLLTESVHINATTGSTGAGNQFSETSHFSWRDHNMSHYKAFEHQHLKEINQNIFSLQPSFTGELVFIPNRGNFTRGIFSTLYFSTKKTEKEITNLFKDFYKDQAFVCISSENINLKQVIQTNKCIIGIQKKTNYLLLTSILDNLLKGASGQAVQNMNLMFGWKETLGLNLKPGGF